MPAFKLKLASTFVLALVEDKLTPLNSLLFSSKQNFPKDFGGAKIKPPKNACISLLNISPYLTRAE